MTGIAETLLEFKIIQLEGRLAIYESLITEIIKLESMEQAVFEVRAKLESVTAVWESQMLGEIDAA